MFVCLSPGGQLITNGETQTDKLLVGTVDGIFSFQKNGGAWAQQATMVPGKHFSSVIFEPTSKMLFGGTYSCEIYRQQRSRQELGAARQRHRREGNLFPRQSNG